MTAAEDTPGPITYYPPVLVACRIKDTTAIWLVETDPDVTRGDFSGAWLLTPDGIQGFAADAEWIEGRDDPAAMARLLFAHPVFLTEESEGDVGYEGMASDLKIIDKTATEQAARDALDRAREEFASANPGKKQPAWGTIRDISPVAGRSPEDLDDDAKRAVTSVLDFARGVRMWARDWTAFDKVRARRLGSEPSEVRLVPLRLEA